jgi:signal transduction histidine kinase
MRSEPRAVRVLKQLAYIGVALPLGTAYLAVLVSTYAIGTVLGLVWIGLPLLLLVTAVAWQCAGLERTLANRLLDGRIPALAELPAGTVAGTWPRLRARLTSPAFWRPAALLALKLPATVLLAAPALLAFALAIALVVLGARGLTGSEAGYVGPFALGAPLGVALCLLAVPVGIVAVALTGGASRVLRALARGLLAPRLQAGGPVRETLAQSLGDSTLSIAYWLADRRTFVDEAGQVVSLPEPGSTRAWTAVDYDGRRVAAIIHDANLDASAELVQAAAAAASLAIDNERLKADLRARVEELRASRVRLVQASDTARRRLERDLHDGAQQQLVALAVDLRVLRRRVGDNAEASELIGLMDEKVTRALVELRELARGIHPAILTDRGLEPALESLGDRVPVPVVVDVDLESRPPAPVEAAAYFVTAEALTNVVKYAEASRADVRVRLEGEEIVVEIEDDGVGGADDRRGTGLRGLHDRVGALDGGLSIRSEIGEGTLVQARIPCDAGNLVSDATSRPAERRGGARNA